MCRVLHTDIHTHRHTDTHLFYSLHRPVRVSVHQLAAFSTSVMTHTAMTHNMCVHLFSIIDFFLYQNRFTKKSLHYFTISLFKIYNLDILLIYKN